MIKLIKRFLIRNKNHVCSWDFVINVKSRYIYKGSHHNNKGKRKLVYDIYEIYTCTQCKRVEKTKDKGLTALQVYNRYKIRVN